MSNIAIQQYSHRQLHSFLDELKNDTRNYRTVSSLGQQVAQEYRGRSIIELLQNAHDALSSAPQGDPRCITFSLRSGPSPTLLIANSGIGFRPDDFRGICQLGQSPKDPNKSVGNKGLGFRSVLELSTPPEVWSSAAGVDTPAFCFGFSPRVLETITQSLEDLQRLGLEARSPFIGTSGLVDWSPETLQQFLENFGLRADELILEIQDHLSPYQFPLELNGPPEEVRRLLDSGHRTVIRLPIDGGRNGNAADAVKSVLEQFIDLTSASMIFLAHVTTLVIDVDGHRRVFRRVARDAVEYETRTGYRMVEVEEEHGECGSRTARTFHLWEHFLGGNAEDAVTHEIAAAVAHLPNRWIYVRSVTLGIAVEDRATSGDGRFVIFLPTTMSTGTGAYINAPFFGSLDRRAINFDDKYNKFLWQYLLHLHLRILRELSLHLDDRRRARVIVDLIGSITPIIGRPSRVLDDILQVAVAHGRPLDEDRLLLCDGGWHRPADTRAMFAVPSEGKISSEIWRKHARFAVLADELSGRHAAVSAICVACNGSLDPLDAEWGATLESLGAAVESQLVPYGWGQFVESVVAILPDRLRESPKPGSIDALRPVRFVPTQSGKRLAASDTAVLFFQPKRSEDDSIGEVPTSLQNRVAFLHADIATQEGPQGRNTAIHRFLDGRFAREFRRDDILRRVVEPAIPALPVANGTVDALLCRDILSWSIRIIGNEPIQSVLNTLKKLPVPCYGGWFPMSEATFGPGWDVKLGEAVKLLAESLPAADGKALLARVLLPPDYDELAQAVFQRRDLLVAGGVLSGLRLQLAKEIRFAMEGRGNQQLPNAAPTGFPPDVWEAWRKEVRVQMSPRYGNWHKYKLQRLCVLPALSHLGSLSPAGVRALSELILASFSHWPSDWPTVSLEKVDGNAWSCTLQSPLRFALRKMKWFADQGSTRPLSRRWHVRESLLGSQRERFSHLDPLSIKMVQRLAMHPPLLEELKRLGLNTYPIEQEQIGPQLLEALATAWDDGRIPPPRLDIFINQVRDGWRYLKADSGRPQRFVVTTGRRNVRTCSVDELNNVYLPDNSDRVRTLTEYGKSILEMWGEDARRLGAALCTATPLHRASRLKEVAIIDGIKWDQQRSDGVPLTESAYAWIPPVVLAISAYGGSTVTGADTKAWVDAANRLRRTRIVECEKINLDLRDENDVVASSEPRALWMSGDTLAICRGSECDLSCLAEPLQTAVDRLDLIRSLRLVFRELSGAGAPASDRIERALAFAEIDAQSLADIRHRWSGSITTLIDRIRPVLALLGLSEEGLENSRKDEEQLGEWLSGRTEAWPPKELLQAARRSRDDATMGRKAHEVLGDIAELPHWNATLRRLGDSYGEVRNEAFIEQATLHMDAISAVLHAMFRWIAKQEGAPQRFLELEKLRCKTTYPTDWARRWWRVPFSAVSRTIAESLLTAGVSDAHAKLLQDSSNADELRQKLTDQGVDVSFAPFEIAAENAKRLNVAVAVVHDAHVVWRESRTQLPPPVPVDLEKSLDPSAYLDSWDAVTTLNRALEVLKDPEFSVACAGCLSAEEIRAHLGLTQEQLTRRAEARQADLAAAARRKRTFSIAGSSFEMGKDDYSSLFDKFSPPAGGGGGAFNLPGFTQLSLPGAASPAGGSGGSWQPGKSSHLRPSAEAREFGGIIGEMLAYRYLQARFGENVVTRGAWVSEIRLKVLPLVPGEADQTSDGHGFDFRFRADNKEWHIEVKATMGDDEEFELSLREVEAASRLVSNKSKPWCILRIRQALASSPQFDWLPNPFDAEHRSYFRMDNMGTRVSYRRKPGGA